MQPKPWSFSSLESFKNCPRAYSETRIYKTVVDQPNEASIWGERVHKHFEDRLTDGVVLPPELECHEPFLAKLESMPGILGVEEKIALNRSGQVCTFFDPNAWYRGVIDAKKVAGDAALIVDHKTGKHHTKFGQLKLFALHTFAAHPEVNTVRCEFYWTQTMTRSGATYTREMVPDLWKQFLPDLIQYRDAFRTETWQPRQSGLCNGWCSVTTCEFWREKRIRR